MGGWVGGFERTTTDAPTPSSSPPQKHPPPQTNTGAHPPLTHPPTWQLSAPPSNLAWFLEMTEPSHWKMDSLNSMAPPHDAVFLSIVQLVACRAQGSGG